jgi:hypothetical protein
MQKDEEAIVFEEVWEEVERQSTKELQSFVCQCLQRD